MRNSAWRLGWKRRTSWDPFCADLFMISGDEVRALEREEAVSDQMLSSAFFKNYVMEGAESILEDRCPDIFRI